nr:MAG TPA: helicase UvrD/REP helicase N-terminal domain [Caudoviricetes sp.]
MREGGVLILGPPYTSKPNITMQRLLTMIFYLYRHF